jgi:hypothetical protein
MKKLVSMLVLVFIIYIVYHDVTKGTLPTYTQKQPDIQTTSSESNTDINYKIIEVKAGDTILSIVEKDRNGPLPVSIEKLIKDFEILNPGVKAEALQIGKTYKFPVYNE